MTNNPLFRLGAGMVLILGALPLGLASAQGAPTCDGQRANIVGTARADVLRGTPDHDTIAGLGGDDIIRGLDGADTICGGAGDDTLLGGAANQDDLHGGEGNDVLDPGSGEDHARGDGGSDKMISDPFDWTVEGGAGDDTYEGAQAHFVNSPAPVEVDLAEGTATGEGADTLIGVNEVLGSKFDDVLLGDAQDNTLRGSNGDDVLEGRGGNDGLYGFEGSDEMSGGSGDDFFSEAEVSGDDHLDGGPGVDGVSVTARSGEISIDLVEGTAIGGGTDTILSFENAFANGAPATLIGTDGPNELRGGGEDDVIHGHGGDDLIDLGSAKVEDRADAGPGDDRIIPGDCCGTSVIEGGEGVDLITFGKFFTDPGGFIIDLFQGTFEPQPNATSGDGQISGIENVIGSPSADVIRGDASANKLVGRGGNDRLAGRAGNDLLVGKKGRDRASGGPGRDICRTESHRGCEN